MSDETVQIDIDDQLLIILMALSAYQIETGEPFSASKEIMSELYKDGAEKGWMPALGLEHTDDNRLNITVEMRRVE